MALREAKLLRLARHRAIAVREARILAVREARILRHR